MARHPRKRRSIATALLFLACAGLASLPDGTALAAAPLSDAELEALGAIEEVVVTARRREEKLQEVPISIRAVTSEFIEDAGLVSFVDLQQYTPNLTITPVTDSRSTAIRIRGIGQTGGNAGFDPSVGVFIDGIYQGRAGMSIQDLLDIERVEVLRGPQGTLYGKNTAGGAINVFTKRPVFKVEGFLEGVRGNYDSWQGRGYLNVPLVKDRVATRLSAYTVTRDGFDENLFNGDRRNDADKYGFRSRTLFSLTDDAELLVSADYSSENSQCCVPDIIRYDGPPSLDLTFRGIADFTRRPLPKLDPFDRKIDVNEDTPNRVQIWGTSADFTQRFGGYTLNWLSAYRTYKSFSNLDGDFSGYNAVFLETDEDFHQVSSELRLISPDLDGLDYVAGLYFYHQRDETLGITGIKPDFYNASPFVGLPIRTAVDANGNATNIDDNVHKTYSYAAFVQANYKLAPQWSLTGGLRLMWEEKSRVGTQRATFVLDAGPFGPPIANDEHFGVFNVSPLLSLRYFPVEDVMTYVTASRGFKSGGFNQLRTTGNVNTQFDDEIATDIELGVKSTLWNRRLTLNADVFHIWYDDLQVQSFDGTSFSVQNAAALRSYGVEADALLVPHKYLTIGLGVGFNRARYSSFPNAQQTIDQIDATRQRLGGGSPLFRCAPGTTVNLPGSNEPYVIQPSDCGQDLGGKPLDNAPEWTVATFAQWEQPLPKAVLPIDTTLLWHLRGEWNYTDQFFLQTDLDPVLLQSAVNLFNLRTGIRAEDSRWELELWMRNVLDERYQVVGFDVPIISGYAGVNAPPRTYGLTARVKF